MIFNSIISTYYYLNNIITNNNIIGGENKVETVSVYRRSWKIFSALGIILWILLTIHWFYILIKIASSCSGMEWYFRVILFICSLFIPFFALITQVIIWFGNCG